VALVAGHVGSDARLGCLRQVLLQHEVVEVVCETRHLVDQSELVHRQLTVRCLGWQLGEDFWTMGVHLDNQVFKLLLVHLEVLHAKVVGESVALVEVLPVVEVVVGVLLADPVHLDTIQVDGNEEEDGETGRGVDVSADVLVVKCDVDPRSGASQICSHFVLLLFIH